MSEDVNDCRRLPLSQYCLERRCDACRTVRGNGPPSAHAEGPQSAHALPLHPRDASSHGLSIAVAIPPLPSSLSLAKVLRDTREVHLRGVFPTARTLIKAISGLDVRFLFLHVGLPDRCGIACARDITALRPGVRIVFISPSKDPLLIRGIFQAGAELCIIEPATVDVWQEALSFIRFDLRYRNQTSLLAASPRALAFELPQNSQHGVTAPLSPREEQVLGCLGEGLYYKEAEERLHVSHSVFRKLQHRIFRKLRAQNRTEALNHWRGRGHRPQYNDGD